MRLMHQRRIPCQKSGVNNANHHSRDTPLMAGLRPCGFGCPVLIPSYPTGGRCALHGGPVKAWAPKATPTPRLRGRANQRRRTQLLAREPLCRTCAQAGRVTVATIADHVVPLAEGGRDDMTNLAPICGPCHQLKIAEESKRGMKRERW